MTIRLEYVPRLTGHAAMGFAVLANAELIASRLSRQDTSLTSWDDRAVVAYDHDEMIGIITYAVLEWQSVAAIRIGYVRPAYRRRGTYRELWNRLVARCREDGLKRIEGSTAVSNQQMRAVAARLGRRESSVNLDFDVPPLVEETPS